MASSQRYDDASHGNGRNIAVALIATASGVAALFAYHTSPGAADATGTAQTGVSDGGAAAAAPAAAAVEQGGTATGGGTGGGTATGGGTVAGGTSAGGAAAAKTYTGKAAKTRWGTVQVKITVQDGKIVSAAAPVSPRGNQQSIDINQSAVPLLNKEAVQAGSAKIDAVSGATVTSGGYVESLQSAIDQANL